METLVAIVRSLAAEDPDRPALTYGGDTTSYAALDTRSDRVAGALHRVGVGPGDRIVFLARNHPACFETILGASKIGAVPVPVNWRLSTVEIAAIVGDAQPVALIGDAAFVEDLRGGGADLGSVRCTVVLDGDSDADVDDFESWLHAHDTVPPEHQARSSDVALQFYTSGTTGVPKGVMLDHRNAGSILRRARADWNLDADAVIQVAMPLFHVAGAGWGMAGLSCGAHVVLHREVDAGEILAAIAEHRVTHTLLVPAVLQLLLGSPHMSTADLSSLQLVVYGASPITEDVLVRSLERFDCAFVQAYGMTETSGSVVLLRAEDHLAGLVDRSRLRAAGRPVDGVELRIVGPDGHDLPVGDVGEIWVRSEQNMVGYWQRPDETAATLVDDGWLRTGDAGYLDGDGYLYLHDRVKDMIVTGGENVFPAEVENALMSHPDVVDVAVIGVPDERWGETIKAFVVARAHSDVAAEDLIAYAGTKVAGYKCPRSVEWVDVLPRNPSGKVLKHALREPYWAGRSRRVN